MAERTIIRGDSYTHRRPVFRITVTDSRGAPIDLTGHTIKVTYKARVTALEDDPLDIFAPIRHELHVNSAGTVTKEDGLVLDGPARSGRIAEYLLSNETKVLPLDTELYGDIEITDPSGDVATYFLEHHLVAKDGYTHRTHSN